MAGNKTPFSISDLYQLKLAFMPRISPDGSRAAYVVKSWDREQDRVKNQIRIHDFKSGETYCLPGDGSEDFPRWSPDGERIAYISKSNGKGSIWIGEGTGGNEGYETRPVQTETEVDSPPVWAPDGQRIAFTGLAVNGKSPCCFYPGSPECRDTYESDATVITKFYHKYDGMGFFGRRNRQIFVVGLAGSGGKEKTRQLTEGNINHYAPAWSPDGRHLVCVVNREGLIERGVFKYDLIRLEPEAGKEQVLLKSDGPIKAPVWSPDGKYIAYIGHQNHAGRVSNDNIWLIPVSSERVYPLTGKEAVNLTAGLDRPVGMTIDSDVSYGSEKILPVFWTRDGKKIYFIAGDRGDGYVYSVETPLSDGEGEKRIRMEPDEAENRIRIEPIEAENRIKIKAGEARYRIRIEAGEAGRTITSFHLAGEEKLLYSSCSPVCPDELFVRGRDGEHRLTRLNDDFLDRVELLPPEQFVFKGVDDLEIPGWVLNRGENHPLVVVIHGGPHLAYGNSFMLQSQVLAAAGFTVFFCNPRGSQTYGQEYASAVVQDWGGKDYGDVLDGVDCLLAEGAADPERIGVMGWSYGGYLTNWLTAKTERFKAGVAGASVSNLYSFYGTSDIGYSFGEFETGGSSCFLKDRLVNRSPITYVSDINTPLLLIHGEKDLRCPISQSEELFTALKRCAKEAVLVRYPGEYHIFEKPSHIIDKYLRIVCWFDCYLNQEGGERCSLKRNINKETQKD